MSDKYRERRGDVNAQSKAQAVNDGLPWESHEIDLLLEWDGTEVQLHELAELLERTVEACRQKFYTARRNPVTSVTTTETTTRTTRTTYRGWTEADGDGWN